jgi:AbrB family looped-hinge helix DNA binding protein
MPVERNLVPIQANGQVTLPADVRERLGLKEGDLVAIEETPEGVLIIPRGVVALKALDEIGSALKEQGPTLEDVIERGRAIREELYRERYGHLDADNSLGFPRQ